MKLIIQKGNAGTQSEPDAQGLSKADCQPDLARTWFKLISGIALLEIAALAGCERQNVDLVEGNAIGYQVCVPSFQLLTTALGIYAGFVLEEMCGPRTEGHAIRCAATFACAPVTDKPGGVRRARSLRAVNWGTRGFVSIIARPVG